MEKIKGLLFFWVPRASESAFGGNSPRAELPKYRPVNAQGSQGLQAESKETEFNIK